MPLSTAQKVAVLFGGPTFFNGQVNVPYSAYSLLDIFDDARAAGAVNGTLPVVGGARVVTDTNSKLSIAGGVASFATGGGGAGNPGLWYPAVTPRVFGRIFLGTIVPANTTSLFYFGMDGSAGGAPLNCILFETDGGIYVIVNNGPQVKVGSYSAVSYQVAVAVRSPGGEYSFIKGGAFTNWTLLWSSAAGTPTLPSVSAGNNATVFTADNLRVPTALFTVPQLAYDTFTRADGALGSTETAGSDGQVVTARAWTEQQGTWNIASNKAQPLSV